MDIYEWSREALRREIGPVGKAAVFKIPDSESHFMFVLDSRKNGRDAFTYFFKVSGTADFKLLFRVLKQSASGEFSEFRAKGKKKSSLTGWWSRVLSEEFEAYYKQETIGRKGGSVLDVMVYGKKSSDF